VTRGCPSSRLIRSESTRFLEPDLMSAPIGV
jgi:hypothetical protein